MKRALNINDIVSYKPEVLDFGDQWLASFGKPELTGSWIIWGNSGNGKTRFALQLAKYFAKFVKTAYDSLEEGLSLSMQQAIISVGMSDVSRKFLFLDKEPIEDLSNRLKKARSPKVVVIDSLQYTGLNYEAYKQLVQKHRNKLFIFVSHADGKEPKGNTAKSIRYDASVKVRIEGYRAFAMSRYGGGAPFTVWEKGAEYYWLTQNTEDL